VYIIKGLCYFCSIIALLGILEFIFKTNIIYSYTDIGLELSYRWMFPSRIKVTHLHPVVLGSYFVICLPFCFYTLFNGTRRVRFMGFFCSSLVFIGILLTFSRGSLIAALVASAVYFAIAKIRIKKYIKISIVIGVLFSILLSFTGARSIWSYLGHKPSIRRNYEGAIERYDTTCQMFKEYPFFGIGLNHYRLYFDKYSYAKNRHEIDKVPDNMYLLILSETGLVGLLGFLFFILSLLRNSYLYLKSTSMPLSSFPIFISSFIGLLVNLLTYDALYWSMPLFFFGILCGLLRSYGDKEELFKRKMVIEAK